MLRELQEFVISGGFDICIHQNHDSKRIAYEGIHFLSLQKFRIYLDLNTIVFNMIRVKKEIDIFVTDQ